VAAAPSTDAKKKRRGRERPFRVVGSEAKGTRAGEMKVFLQLKEKKGKKLDLLPCRAGGVG